MRLPGSARTKRKGKVHDMEGIEYVKPGEIEARSFAIIEEELKERGLVIPE